MSSVLDPADASGVETRARNEAFIAMGANLPHDGVEGPTLLARAVEALRAAGLSPMALSGVWRTAAWPSGSGQPDYYNAVAVLDPGGLSPQRLYEALAAIELQFGRVRRERWAARTLDLDIIAQAGYVGVFGDVTLPHPRMHERSFVLAPLLEVAPTWRHPVKGMTVEAMLAAAPPDGRIRVGDLDTALSQAPAG